MDVEDSWNIRKSKDSSSEMLSSKSWAESDNNQKSGEIKHEQKIEENDQKKTSEKVESDLNKEDKRHTSGRGRSDVQNRSQVRGSGNSTFFVRNNSYSYSKKGSSGRSGWSSGPPRPSSAKSAEFYGTDSEISADEVFSQADGSRRAEKSPKPQKKFEKEEKNLEAKHDKSGHVEQKAEKHDGKKENYVARGEPSRHGRGGSNFRGSRSGFSKRMEGYGPPPSKIPFSHHDEKEKKPVEENSEVMSSDEKSKNQRKDITHSQQSYRKSEDRHDRHKIRRGPDNRRGKHKKDDVCDTGSDNSDDSVSKDGKHKKLVSGKIDVQGRGQSGNISNPQRRNNPPPRMSSDKRSNYGSTRNDQGPRQNSSGSLRTNTIKKRDEKANDGNSLANAIADISLKNRDNEESVSNLLYIINRVFTK